MKNFLKLFGIVLAVATVLLLSSCEDIVKKGGSVHITNEHDGVTLGVGLERINYFIVVKDLDVANAWKDLANGKGTVIKKGETQTITKDEDGFYTVIAMYPSLFSRTVYLGLGNSENVTIK